MVTLVSKNAADILCDVMVKIFIIGLSTSHKVIEQIIIKKIHGSLDVIDRTGASNITGSFHSIVNNI
jgi:hypothetical protein